MSTIVPLTSMRERQALRLLPACVAIVAIILSGCATSRWPPPPEPLREKLGTVAIVHAPADLPAPTGPQAVGAGAGAKSGFKQGSLGTLKGAWIVFADGGRADGLGALFAVGVAAGLVVLSPVVGVAGGVVGAARAHTPDEVEATDAELRAFVEAQEPDRDLAYQIAATAMKTVPEQAVGVVENDDDDPNDLWADSADDRSRYLSQGYDSVLRISTGYSFEVEGEISPDVKLTVRVDAMLSLLDSDAAAYQRRWQYVGDPKNYFALSADQAKPFEEYLRGAYATVAEKVVHDLFVADKPRADGSSRVRTIWAGSVVAPATVPPPN